jgi:hypothetical protein
LSLNEGFRRAFCFEAGKREAGIKIETSKSNSPLKN